MKRVVYFLIVLSLLLAACVAPSASTGGANAGAAQEQDVIQFYAQVDRIEGHPWNTLIEEYNAAHPDVHVEFLQATFTGGWWEWLGTLMAAGNPPDVMSLSIAGLYQDKAGDLPLVVDAAPWMDEAYLEDVAWCRSSMQPYAKIINWPMNMSLGDGVAVNTAVLDAAGIDWKKIQDEGWTVDEFRAIAKTLTVDIDGDGEIDQWGYGNALEWFRGMIEESLQSAGVAANSGPGFYMWGNQVDWNQPEFAAWLDTVAAMMLEDGSIPEAVLGLPAIQSGHELFYGGQVAMTYGYLGMPAAMQAWNDQIDSGETVGEKIEWEMALLPMPYSPPHESVNMARCSGLTIFKQEPYKGDDHTNNVMEFARWLSEPENMKLVTDFYPWLPARRSLVEDSVAFNDPLASDITRYKMERAACTFPMGHPVSGRFRADVFNKWLLAVVRGEVSGAEAVDKMEEEAQVMLDQWVAENPDMVDSWAQAPWGDWPECYFTPGSALTPRE